MDGYLAVLHIFSPHQNYTFQTHHLTWLFIHFWPPLTPASDSLITTLWLAVGSSHSEMYGHREKWRANSIRSIIPEAVVSAALWRCFDVLPSRSVLHRLPPPSRNTEIKVVVFWGEGEACPSHCRQEGLFLWSGAQRWFNFTERMQQCEVRRRLCMETSSGSWHFVCQSWAASSPGFDWAPFHLPTKAWQFKL